ncbi:uncharacterized protein LOC109417649 isoform X2 [Aedes albopictus]|uniref:Uncharacterized protein n=1 Tax=Aedes albopictus TaxID=7160 RepID=A0ABM1YA18_AEDAL
MAYRFDKKKKYSLFPTGTPSHILIYSPNLTTLYFFTLVVVKFIVTSRAFLSTPSKSEQPAKNLTSDFRFFSFFLLCFSSRNHSKDSQQSSQSDLSLTGGSPKLQTKASSTRPAKKRDVRTINSSSSDLGPPSKTVGSNGNGTATVTVTTSNNNTNNQHQQQTQHQRASLRAAATLQKRISSTPGSGLANTTIPSIVPEQLKGSPPPPKRNFIAKRTLSTPVQGSTVVKTPLKGTYPFGWN